jgi:hypothetical protein
MDLEARLVTVDHVWSGRWLGPHVVRASDAGIHLLGAPDAASGGLPHLRGTLLSPFTDSHVHLGLVDPVALGPGGIGRVLDLGWDPDEASLWPEHGRLDDAWPEAQVAGGLLCPPGGYPSRAGWAPSTASVEVADAADAHREVRRMRDLGASVVKVTLNSDVGPVFGDAVLHAIVEAAADVQLLTIAHVQGVGQARRALDAGLLRFAHTPFSEVLTDDLVDVAADGTWISTLDIHGRGRRGPTHEIAVANLTRFRAAGGHVLYGTDLGNGELPVGVNERELRALERCGLGLDALLHALGSDDSLDAGHDGRHWSRRATWIPTAPPTGELEEGRAAAWLAEATVLTVDTLVAAAAD